MLPLETQTIAYTIKTNFLSILMTFNARINSLIILILVVIIKTARGLAGVK